MIYNIFKCRIIGPQCIRYALESNQDCVIQSKRLPPFTLAMRRIVITLTGFENTAEKV